MDFAALASWLAGGVALVGLLQWLKGLVPGAPSWVWGIAAPILAAGWAVAPDWARQAVGVLAVSQIGYETIIQAVKKKLGGAA